MCTKSNPLNLRQINQKKNILVLNFWLCWYHCWLFCPHIIAWSDDDYWLADWITLNSKKSTKNSFLRHNLGSIIFSRPPGLSIHRPQVGLFTPMSFDVVPRYGKVRMDIMYQRWTRGWNEKNIYIHVIWVAWGSFIRLVDVKIAGRLFDCREISKFIKQTPTF